MRRGGELATKNPANAGIHGAAGPLPRYSRLHKCKRIAERGGRGRKKGEKCAFEKSLIGRRRATALAANACNEGITHGPDFFFTSSAPLSPHKRRPTNGETSRFPLALRFRLASRAPTNVVDHSSRFNGTPRLLHANVFNAPLSIGRALYTFLSVASGGPDGSQPVRSTCSMRRKAECRHATKSEPFRCGR